MEWGSGEKVSVGAQRRLNHQTGQGLTGVKAQMESPLKSRPPIPLIATVYTRPYSISWALSPEQAASLGQLLGSLVPASGYGSSKLSLVPQNCWLSQI